MNLFTLRSLISLCKVAWVIVVGFSAHNLRAFESVVINISSENILHLTIGIS